ncbi:hypothetical protein NPIL_302541, partial [Nephila pilipes]
MKGVRTPQANKEFEEHELISVRYVSETKCIIIILEKALEGCQHKIFIFTFNVKVTFYHFDKVMKSESQHSDFEEDNSSTKKCSTKTF